MSIRYMVRGDVSGESLSLFNGYGLSLLLLLCSSFFPVPLFMGTPFSYIAPLKSSDLTPVDHLDLHLSARPIGYLPHFSVSCSSQGNTVRQSSPH